MTSTVICMGCMSSEGVAARFLDFSRCPVQTHPVQTCCGDINIVGGTLTKKFDYRHVHYPESLCKTIATIRVVKGSFSRIAVAKLSQHSKAKACELPRTTSSDAYGLRADAPVYLVGLAVQKVQPICHLQQITCLILGCAAAGDTKEHVHANLGACIFLCKWSGNDCVNLNQASLQDCCCCFRLGMQH